MGSIEERLRRLDQKMGFKRPFEAWGTDPRRGWAVGAWMSVYNALLFAVMLVRAVAEGWVALPGVVVVLTLAVIGFSSAAGFCFANWRTYRGSDHR